MKQHAKISPSILSADFMNLKSEVDSIASADLLHFDVMDGHFVPNLTFGPEIMRQVKQNTSLAIDAHLMVSNPEDAIQSYIDAGADYVTFHIEAAKDPAALVERIHAAGRRAGIAISPDTPAESIYPYLASIELVLVMTVYPGFGGQSFIEAMLPKIEAIRATCDEIGANPMIAVDGGIAPATIALAARAGADTFACGSTVFGAADRAARISELRSVAEGA